MLPDDEIRSILARIDERVLTIGEQITEIKRRYVTQDEWRPVKLLVYGLVGAMLIGVVTAILALVLKG